MSADRRNIRSVSKLISKRVVSTGTKFLLNGDNNKSFDMKLEELWLSKQEAMTIFVDEIDKVREEIKLQIQEYLGDRKRNGFLKFVDESLIADLIEMSEPQPNSEEKPKIVLPSLELSNIRESSRSSTRSSREHKEPLSDSAESSSHRCIVESPDYIEVSDSSIEKSAVANMIVNNIFDREKQTKPLSSPHSKSLKTTKDISFTDNSKTKLNQELEDTRETLSSTFYSVPSTDDSSKSAGECEPWRNARAIPVFPDGSVMKTPRVLENDDLEQEMKYSSHRLSDSFDEILSLSDRNLNDESKDTNRNPKVVQVDISSSFGSNQHVECISARSLVNEKIGS